MRRRFFVLVTVVMVLVGMFPINSHAMERRSINDVILSENPDVPLSERELLIALLKVNVQKSESLEEWDFLHHDKEWLEKVQQDQSYPMEYILADMHTATNQLLLWQRLELQAYSFLDDESFEKVIAQSNKSYEIVYQIRKALSIPTEYLSITDF